MPRVAIRPLFLGQSQGTFGPGAVCLDDNEQPISCSDPNCALGDCGSTLPQLTGSLCLGPTVNGVESPIACNDPMCTYGDCTNAPATPTQNIVPRPSPTVPSTPATTPTNIVVNLPSGTTTPALTTGTSWFSQSTVIPGLPNYVIALVGVIAVAAVAGGGRR